MSPGAYDPAWEEHVMFALHAYGRMACDDGRVLAELESLITGRPEREVGSDYRHTDAYHIERAVIELEARGQVYVSRRNNARGPSRGNPVQVLRCMCHRGQA